MGSRFLKLSLLDGDLCSGVVDDVAEQSAELSEKGIQEGWATGGGGSQPEARKRRGGWGTAL